MAIPSGAPFAEQPMDPSDMVEFVGRFAPPATATRVPLFEADETIADLIDLSVLPDAAALGFTILSGMVDGKDRGPWIADDNKIVFWTTVAEAKRGDPAFDAAAGAELGVQATVRTSKGRRYQRTLGIRARHQ